MGSILIVEDDASSAQYLVLALRDMGHKVRHAPDGLAAVLSLEESVPDLVITDLQMPRMDGIELLGRIRERWQGLPVILISVVGEVETVVSAVKHGAVNYLLKPCSPQRIADAVEKALRARLPPPSAGLDALGRIVGKSRGMVEVRHAIELAARSDLPVLLTGATGTGKELAARASHALSKLAAGPFLAHNCATTPRELFDSVLFGHVRGAFTGADRDCAGLLREADGGVLFLDELEAMTFELQAKLLRVLDDGESRPVGGTKSYHVSVRFLAATNRDPQEMIREGTLRQDLYYRLRGIEIHLPPLAQRLEDLPLLVAYFLGRERPACTLAALDVLRAHPWPGNVRELKNVLLAARARATDREIEPGDLGLEYAARLPRASDVQAGTPTSGLGSLREAEQDIVERTLRAFGGNRSRTAKALGIDRSTLRRMLARKAGERTRGSGS